MSKQYHMRAWDSGAASFVNWVVNGSPDLIGEYYPGGSSGLTNITINKVEDSKIDNKLQPYNSVDGYIFHLNSYDWLKPLRTSSDSDSATDPIPVPTKNVGVAIVRGTADGSTPRNYASLHWDETQGTFVLGFTTNELESLVSTKPLITGHLNIIEGDEDGYLSVTNNSKNPSTTGVIRLPNNEIITFRNNADSTDINGLYTNTSDELVLNDMLYIKTNYINFNSSISNPTISQKINISGAGSNLFVSAQSTTVALNNGGDLYLSSGIAGAGGVNGLVDIRLGGNTTLKIETGLTTTTNPLFKFYKLVGDSTIYIDDINDLNADGYSLTIHPQNAIDGYGGNLILASGIGNVSLVDDGYIDFRIGDTQVGQYFANASNSTYQAFTNLFQIDGVLETNNRINVNIDYVDNTITINNTDGYYFIAVDSTNNILTISLPATPSEGDTYQFKDVGGAATNNWTLSGNGINIDNGPSIAVSTNYQSIVVTYVGGAVNKWLTT